MVGYADLSNEVWVGAGASGNVLHIVSLASEIPDRTEPECDNW